MTSVSSDLRQVQNNCCCTGHQNPEICFLYQFYVHFTDYSQIPGYVEITAAVPNWKRDMIEKKNEEKVHEYLVSKSTNHCSHTKLETQHDREEKRMKKFMSIWQDSITLLNLCVFQY